MTFAEFYKMKVIKKATKVTYSFLPNIDLSTHKITDRPITVPQLMLTAKSNPADTANQFQMCSKHQEIKKLKENAKIAQPTKIATDWPVVSPDDLNFITVSF
ncbi:hypothetical protein ACME8T_09105 [Morganella morganii]|uniref:hypothetical protein n=1 Tax=Morganella morganii TaxID=582 RepID=UPI003CFF8B03